MSIRPRILVMTPIAAIDGVREILDKAGEVTYLPDPQPAEARTAIADKEAVFTNPNKSKVFISKELIDAAPGLKVICTASTGTNHIDLEHAKKRNVRVLALTEEREVINRISSTAEHAFALTLAALRRVPQAWDSVKRGEWDYEPFVGRQLNQLTVGVVGYGRLGKLYAGYAKAFGAKVLVLDPYQKTEGHEQVDEGRLLAESDVISLHVHATPETAAMVNERWFGRMKPGALLVNTARGDVVDEQALVRWLEAHPKAFYATDVLADETRTRASSPVLKVASEGQVLVTPHVGGMTLEGQRIAYRHAAGMLSAFFGRPA